MLLPPALVTILTALFACTTSVSAYPAAASFPTTQHLNPNAQSPLSPLDLQAAIPIPQSHNTKPHAPKQTRLPTRRESTLLARRLLALHSGVGYLASVFPPVQNLTSDPVYRYTPDSVADAPIALPEYFAGDCDDDDQRSQHGRPGGGGDPVMIRLGISTVGKNSRGGANVSLGLDWWADYEKVSGGKRPWSVAGLPRLSLLGTLDVLTESDVESGDVVRCFERKHGDARAWRPGSERGAHAGEWVRLRVQHVYWVGGFGDTAWIGWLDVEGGEWGGIGRKEWESVRLPGEKGWWDMPWFEGGKALPVSG